MLSYFSLIGSHGTGTENESVNGASITLYRGMKSFSEIKYISKNIDTIVDAAHAVSANVKCTARRRLHTMSMLSSFGAERVVLPIETKSNKTH